MASTSEDDERPERRSGGEGLVLAVAALALFGCCGLPLLAALAGSVALGTLLGVGGGVLAAVALVGGVLAWRRARRRACAPCAGRGLAGDSRT